MVLISPRCAGLGTFLVRGPPLLRAHAPYSGGFGRGPLLLLAVAPLLGRGLLPLLAVAPLFVRGLLLLLAVAPLDGQGLLLWTGSQGLLLWTAVVVVRPPHIVG